jgi:hypothetical protein
MSFPPIPLRPVEIPPGGMDQAKEDLAKVILDTLGDLADWILGKDAAGRDTLTLVYDPELNQPQTPHDAGQCVS